MKAARLHEIGTSLKVEEVAEPELKPGGVIVRVLASHVPNFMSVQAELPSSLAALRQRFPYPTFAS